MKLQLSMDNNSQSILLHKLATHHRSRSSVEKKETHTMLIFEQNRLLPVQYGKISGSRGTIWFIEDLKQPMGNFKSNKGIISRYFNFASHICLTSNNVL